MPVTHFIKGSEIERGTVLIFNKVSGRLLVVHYQIAWIRTRIDLIKAAFQI